MNKIVHKPEHPFVGIDIEGIDAVLKGKKTTNFSTTQLKISSNTIEIAVW